MKLSQLLIMSLGMTASVVNAGETASTGFTGTVWAQGVSQAGGWYDAQKMTLTIAMQMI